MTQDEIIEMAKQSGAAVGKPTPAGPNIVITQCLDIYAFAKLVDAKATAKEREACAKRAAVALLGTLKTTSERVLNAIRARGEA